MRGTVWGRMVLRKCGNNHVQSKGNPRKHAWMETITQEEKNVIYSPGAYLKKECGCRSGWALGKGAPGDKSCELFSHHSVARQACSGSEYSFCCSLLLISNPKWLWCQVYNNTELMVMLYIKRWVGRGTPVCMTEEYTCTYFTLAGISPWIMLDQEHGTRIALLPVSGKGTAEPSPETLVSFYFVDIGCHVMTVFPSLNWLVESSAI